VPSHRAAWAGVSFREGGATQNTRPPLLSTAIERIHKTDRMGGASDVRGAVVPAFTIETANSLVSTVTLRDSNGSILYQVSPLDRTTTVAKRAAQRPILSGSRAPVPPLQSATVEKNAGRLRERLQPVRRAAHGKRDRAVRFLKLTKTPARKIALREALTCRAGACKAGPYGGWARLKSHAIGACDNPLKERLRIEAG
jgi:hypothetical protein